MRKNLQDAFGGLFPFGSLEEMGKQNLALFEKTMKMFSPFPGGTMPGMPERPVSPPPQAAAPSAPPAPGDDRTIKDLNQRLDQLQKKLEEMSKGEKQS